MPPLKMRRIDCSTSNAVAQLKALRDQFSSDGDVVSARDRKLTQAVFGEALSPVQSVDRILADVRSQGLEAVLRYTEAFDKVKLTAKTIRVPASEMADAYASAAPEFLETIRRIRENILAFQMGLVHTSAILPVTGMYELELRYRPMRRVGICCPGGAAAYPSTLLMTVCPAIAAGVKELVVVMPPRDSGAYNKDMLAVCHMLGVKEVYRIGGAQAVGAMAYGVQGIEPVDMIVGPGNLFVALAKKKVFGQVAIDCIAGPSEVVVLADSTSNPAFLAADLIAQAEHSPGVPILVSKHAPLFDAVDEALEHQLGELSRSELTRDCLERFGSYVLVKDDDEMIRITNELAPEHLHIQTRDPEAMSDQIDNAGAIFLGTYTPVALGDYAAGPSHVLPTGGTSRFTSGLNANDFMKRTSIISFTRSGLREIADDVVRIAEKEGLTGHAASVTIRLQEIGAPAKPKKPEKPAVTPKPVLDKVPVPEKPSEKSRR
ncbi:histidinol dehydrogenase [Tuwongella immobilis]|uniref:Histidinol dehydrogenase n=1 Tax=Tuwongella immobilis TaxID=692036 RepID=A0A6C2YY18_9BACT|nr:histidinol dehydrogenase [Tuwongella immobilis]VIP05739.1 histidinol dehydrogenase : Histidinol dehydrogenase OS=Singulisphaera acidiphila (strain ATCC BAA-1392 / DSM 18658 / VKM B-2454 / MOB10) GN=hisD PE=3 SV=1: Histidinol_dh [Tuwongella immobilis]VTS08834.1 histidinol dehydrogenase : Histidinol dehydrogenase OS=Singulisphaera acidiphila (strain ATCC BAA-1392 / DSM 18658 / VKM B-2454 / MOB10) GN=hisD PE=3 SV=1: Histidinol_dh [Tuwongella immobilis]